MTRVRATSFKLNYMLGWGTETDLLELELTIKVSQKEKWLQLDKCYNMTEAKPSSW